MSVETNYNIVVTDLARGDDEAAVVWIMGAASNSGIPHSFVSAFGNRPTAVCGLNLLQLIPEANERLKNPLNQVPQVVFGTDRPRGKRHPYLLSTDAIEYQIHGDMGNDHYDSSQKRFYKNSVTLYKRIAKDGQKKISMLSLGATSELPTSLTLLKTRLEALFIMGGVLHLQGNTDPDQEANFRHDPAATIKTFELARKYGVPIILIPIDVSEQEGVIVTQDRLKYLADKLGNNYGMQVLLRTTGPESTYGRFYLQRTYHRPEYPYREIPYNGVPLHDLTAAVVQDDYQKGNTIFSYTEASIKPNRMGQVGIARKYMQPNFSIIIAGPLLDYDDYWRKMVEYFDAYR